MNIYEFQKSMTKYYEITVYDKLPEVVQGLFKRRSSRFISINFQTEEEPLNIIKVNVENFLKKSKLNIPFLKDNKQIEVYILEYIKPYFEEHRNNNYHYAHSEMIYDLFIYHKETNDVIAYTEIRLGNNTFETYFQNAFIGMIKVENAFQNNRLSFFMLRLSASYVWYRQRKKMYSGTLLSDEFLPILRKLEKETSWIKRDDHVNSYTNKKRERYEIKPIKYHVKVNDAGLLLEF